MVELIGSQPDFHEGLSSGRQLYVFNRPWEYIQLLVNGEDAVLSVGVYAKTTSFKATLVDGIVLNGPPVGRQMSGDPISAEGTCGASWYDYYETYGTSMAGGQRSIIFGDIAGTDTNDQSLGASCGPMLSNKPCIAAYYKSRTLLSTALVSCLTSFSEWRQLQNSAPPAVVIITAPSQPILSDMLNYDYFFTLE